MPGHGTRVSALHALVAAAALGAGCAAPDRPPALPDPLPATFHEYVAPDTLRTLRVAEGVWYRYVWSPRGPWAIHLVEADLRRCELGLAVVRAPREEGKSGGQARVSEMVAGAGADAILVAVNGDFFTPEGVPLGPEMTPGALRTLRARPVVGWRPGGQPWIGQARVEDDTVLAVGSWRVAHGEATGAVVGGYPELLDGGERVGDLHVADNPGFAASRHPRTAVGFQPSRSALWLVVVDGRQGGYSLGMTLPELTGLFESLSVPDALNLDGGGSSVMVIRGRARSHPSEEEGERPVVNALVLRHDPDFCIRGGRSAPARR